MTDEPMDPVEGEEAEGQGTEPGEAPEAESPTTDPGDDEVSQVGQSDERSIGLTGVPVKELADALLERSDPDEVREIQSFDTRPTAQEHYERRLEVLAATGADVDTGEATGYTVGRFYSSAQEQELENYECASCSYATLHLERIEAHVAAEHRAIESSEEAP